MKKILLIAAFFVSAASFTSCTKEDGISPAEKSKSVADDDTRGGRLGTGDADPPKPPKQNS
jgi:hypothetical protein